MNEGESNGKTRDSQVVTSNKSKNNYLCYHQEIIMVQMRPHFFLNSVRYLISLNQDCLIQIGYSLGLWGAKDLKRGSAYA
jgi:hypothetical protein